MTDSKWWQKLICIEIRNKRILRLLKKKNPYTGIINCKDVENSIK
jgi:hypothetical protein